MATALATRRVARDSVRAGGGGAEPVGTPWAAHVVEGAFAGAAVHVVGAKPTGWLVRLDAPFNGKPEGHERLLRKDKIAEGPPPPELLRALDLPGAPPAPPPPQSPDAAERAEEDAAAEVASVVEAAKAKAKAAVLENRELMERAAAEAERLGKEQVFNAAAHTTVRSVDMFAGYKRRNNMTEKRAKAEPVLRPGGSGVLMNEFDSNALDVTRRTTFEEGMDGITAFCLSADGSRYYAGGNDRGVRVRSLAGATAGDELGGVPPEKHWLTDKPVILLKLSADESELFVGFDDGACACWRVADWTCLWTVKPPEAFADIYLYDPKMRPKPGEQVPFWKIITPTVRTMELSDDGLLFCGSPVLKDFDVYVWRTPWNGSDPSAPLPKQPPLEEEETMTPNDLLPPGVARNEDYIASEKYVGPKKDFYYRAKGSRGAGYYRGEPMRINPGTPYKDSHLGKQAEEFQPTTPDPSKFRRETGRFEPAEEWKGPRDGFYFSKGTKGLGYYEDAQLGERVGKGGEGKQVSFEEKVRPLDVIDESPEDSGKEEEEDQEPFRLLRGHKDKTFAMLFNHARTILYTANADCAVKMWSVSELKCVRTLSGHRAGVRALALASDESLLFSGGADKSVHVWDMSNFTPLRVMMGAHAGFVTSIAVHPAAGAMLFTGSEALFGDSSVMAWRVRDGMSLATLFGHDEKKGVNALACSPSGTELYSAGGDGRVIVWNVGEKSVSSKWEKRGFLNEAPKPLYAES